MKTDICLCWTMDCEATKRAFDDAAAGIRSIRGFAEVIAEAGLRATLFVLPGDAVAYPHVLADLRKQDIEVGLHYHPQEEGYDDFCGAYAYRQQLQMCKEALEKFSDAVGWMPDSFRTGSFSANDATYSVTAELGFKQCSHSLPGRRMTPLRANWPDAPPHVHYANPANRLLEGGLDLVEVPVTTDPDSMLWSGAHPQDLRVELFDAANQRYMIDKMLAREKAAQRPIRATVTLTHNLFDYDKPDNFRRKTMQQMIADFRTLADAHDVNLVPATIGEIATAYRQAVPPLRSVH